MKKKLGILVAIFSLSTLGYGQLSFSVSPGLSTNAANIGWKINKFVPFIGCQYFGGKFDYQYTYKQFNYDTFQMEILSAKDEAKVNLFLPTIGVKYFFVETDKLKAFATLNLSKPILSGKVTTEDGVVDEFDTFFEGIKIWAGEFSLGTEYFFDEHFSVGGEFGLRMINVNVRNEYDQTVYNPITDDYENFKALSTVKSSIKPTFTRVSLNFYF